MLWFFQVEVEGCIWSGLVGNISGWVTFYFNKCCFRGSAFFTIGYLKGGGEAWYSLLTIIILTSFSCGNKGVYVHWNIQRFWKILHGLLVVLFTWVWLLGLGNPYWMSFHHLFTEIWTWNTTWNTCWMETWTWTWSPSPLMVFLLQLFSPQLSSLSKPWMTDLVSHSFTAQVLLYWILDDLYAHTCNVLFIRVLWVHGHPESSTE